MFPDEEFYCPPPDVLRFEAMRSSRGHFNVIEHASGFKADMYPAGRDPLHAWALPRATQLEYAGHTLRVAPPEYVIVRKLEFFREGGAKSTFVTSAECSSSRPIRSTPASSPDSSKP